MRAMGVSVEVPAGWEGRIFRRSAPAQPPSQAGPAAQALPSASTHTVTQLANFALPVDPGDFGSEAVPLMGPEHVLLVLFEHHPSSTGAPLFQGQGLPKALDAESFSPSGLQRALPGQAGAQVFFSAAGRAFCLYVVLGSFANRARLVGVVNSVLRTLEIGAA